VKTGPDMTRERTSAYLSALHASGMRVTRQRLEIIKELAGAHDHPDAEDLFHRVRERVPALSQDTVYRTLATLVERGLIARIPMPRATRFDPDVTVHHHFICDRCGRLVDVKVDAAPALEMPAVLPGIGDVHSVSVKLWGVCDGCRP